MHEQQQQKSPQQEMALNVNALVGACQIVCMILYAFLRTPGSWGSRFAGFRMMFSWVFLFCFGPLFYRAEDPTALMLLFLAATVMLLVHRVSGVTRRARGYECHSLYPGNSWLGKPERDVVLLFISGLLSLSVSRPLAAYLLTCAACMFVSEAWMQAARAAKKRAMKDAQFEAEAMMDE